MIPVLASIILLSSALAQAINDSTTWKTQLFIAVTAVITFATVLAGQIFGWRRETRNRHWFEEDRRLHEEARDRAEQDRKQIVQKVESVSGKVEIVKNKADEVGRKLNENTEITKTAAVAATTAKEVVASRLQEISDNLDKRFESLANKNGNGGGDAGSQT